MANGDIFSGLTRGIPGVTPRDMKAPAASFESPDRIRAAGSVQYTPDKFFLGVMDADIQRDENTGERYAQNGIEIGVATDQHAITIAGSRAGKGRAAILPNMLRYAGSAIAIDPKGELARETARTRAETIGQRVCILDPFGVTGTDLEEFQVGFNPLAILHVDSPTLVIDCGLIADALTIVAGNDPHWDESARSFLELLLLHVVSYYGYEGRRNLVTLRDVMLRGTTIQSGEMIATGFDGLQREIEHNVLLLQADAEDAENFEHSERIAELAVLIEGAAADFFDKGDRERASVLSTARRQLKFLDYPQLRRSLSPSDDDEFSLTQLKTEPGGMSVYMCLPAGRMGTCARWFRLFINLALEAMERTPGKPATGCPVLFVLDEFATLGHMRQIEDAAGQIAGFGVKLWPILQDLGQLKALYKDRWETFMGNAGILQFFGNNDLTTLEWVSKRLGKTTMEQLSGSTATPDAKAKGTLQTGQSYSPQAVSVMEPDEIALVFGRPDAYLRQLVIRSGYAPMILQRAYYDKHKAFTGSGT